MLVLCVGMYRACSTWQFGVASHLLERHRDGVRLGFADGDQFVSEIEPGLDTSAWSTLKAHNAHWRFAQLLAEGKALGLYSHRDLRDVAYSWMHKTGASFEEIIQKRFLQLCLSNDRFWRNSPGMLLQSYEPLIAEPVRGVVEIARHLGIELEPGEAEETAEALSLEANRKRTVAISEKLQAEGVALDSRDLDHYDPKTLLHWNHVRSGRAGSWREVATREQKQAIARVCGPWLVDHGYEADLAWAGPLEWEPPSRSLPRISYARNGEDILLDRIFGDQIGTFVDIGASHPTVDNKTNFFYLRGWRGVNIEPVFTAFEAFPGRRPEDLNLQLVIADSEEDLPFYEVVDQPNLSSLSPETVANGKAEGLHVVERSVSTRTVAGLIDRYDLVPPDLFSISVEGDEGRVLGGIPLETWKPRVFVIDGSRTTVDHACHPAWEPILLEQGYLFATFDGISRFYVRDDLADKLPLFTRPVNAVDSYIRAETFEQQTRADSLQRLLEAEHRRADETHGEMIEAKIELAELKVRFGNELDDRHRHYLAWLDEKAAWQEERAAGEAQRQALEGQVQAVTSDRDDLARRIEELDREREALAREVDSLHGVIGRLQGEVESRDVEINRTLTRLRPYLKIDRLGVVTAIQQKVHAHRAHSKA